MKIMRVVEKELGDDAKLGHLSEEYLGVGVGGGLGGRDVIEV